MRTIRKSAEPAALTRYRHTPGATYEDFSAKDGKDELREALIREQRHLCCYCMGEVSAERSRIEHWQSRTNHPHRQLDYRNLLAACHGSEGTPHTHCDVRKADQPLSRNPADPGHSVEKLIRYRKDGRIESTIPEFDRELNQVLNLNSPNLVDNRKSVLTGFTAGIVKRGQVSRAEWERWLKRWSGEGLSGPLPPFAMVVVDFIIKKLPH